LVKVIDTYRHIQQLFSYVVTSGLIWVEHPTCGRHLETLNTRGRYRGRVSTPAVQGVFNTQIVYENHLNRFSLRICKTVDDV